jgi:hypothetical protein
LVTGIGADAFYEKSGLTNVTIPDSVTTIGGGAFVDTSLASVTISANVTNIQESAFASYSLATITVDAQNTCYSSTNGILFDKNQAALVEFPTAIGGSYAIPSGVTIIGDGAFALCTNLTNVTIPAGVASIGDNAFRDCPRLTSITIPSSVTNIGQYVFFVCSGLTNVTVGSGLTNIGDYAFQSCGNLAGIYFAGNGPTADSTVFLGDGNLTTYYLPGTTGWSNAYWGYPSSGPPAVLWNPIIQTGDASFGVRSNQFGFNITGTNDFSVAVEACTNLASPVWTPLLTLTLSNGSAYFTDPQWTNYTSRYYGLGFP